MKEQTDKYLDELAKKVITNTVIESPSFDFTSSVMSQVAALSNNNVTIYKPLISKTGWVLILVGFLSLVFFALFGTQTESSGWLSTIDFSVLTNNKLTNTLMGFKPTGFAITKTFAYALMLFGVMICIQIPFLKHHLNQRFEN
jgi:hypothetical protein